ncbi:MAG: hydrolase [Candidatus Binatia bacterium]
MTTEHDRELRWIDGQREAMCERVAAWASIGSGTYNLEGLSRLHEVVSRRLQALGAAVVSTPVPPEQAIDGTARLIDRPLGPLVTAAKHGEAKLQILLACHLDTVFAVDDPFREVTLGNDGRLRGPGVVDAKGGVVVMLTALEALERSALAGRVGWKVVLNSDEEIGSPGSADLLREAARGRLVGLVYEPALPDGDLVSARKGSGNFTVVVRGVASHAGRDFENGRSAVSALARLVIALEDVGRSLGGVTVNVAKLEGGGPYNVVPELALARFNVRVDTDSEMEEAERVISLAVARASEADGIRAELHGEFRAPPRPVTPAMQVLMNEIESCGADLGIGLGWRATGGVCDGNRLAAAGLPTVDTLGPRGGGLHSREEFLIVDSLVERARISALFLMKLAAGEIDPRGFVNED